MSSEIRIDKVSAAGATSDLTLDAPGGRVKIAKPEAGAILQVQQFVKRDTTTSTSGQTFVDTGLAVAITPKFSTSKILVQYDITCGTAYWIVQFRLMRNGVDLPESWGIPEGASQRGVTSAVKAYRGTSDSSTDFYNSSASFMDSPNTTDPVTYSVQFAGYSTSYNVYINRSHDNRDGADYDPITISTITAWEIAQ